MAVLPATPAAAERQPSRAPIAATAPTAAAPAAPSSTPDGQATPPPAEASALAVPGALLVTTRGVAGGAGLLERLPATVRRGLGSAAAHELLRGVTRVTVEPHRAADLQAALEASPGVVAVEQEREWRWTGAVPNDPLYQQGLQWSHALADAPRGWAVTTGDASRRIAVVDNGVDGGHPDLTGRVVESAVVRRGASGRMDVVRRPSGGNNEATCDLGYRGHGTGVAGVAAATGNNGVGITGVAWQASIVDISLSTDDFCAPSDAKVIAALAHIAAGRVGAVDVVNLSVGGREPSGRCPTALQQAINEVVKRGTAVVVASGNDGYLDFSVPAGCRGVIVVGATGPTGRRAAYSSMGRYLDLVAPGGVDGRCTPAVCVLTTRTDPVTGQHYAVMAGTSFSAPYVSGLVLLLRTLRPSLSPAQLESVLELTAKHPAGRGRHDHEHGWGMVQAGAALRHVQGGLPIPPPRVHPAVRIAAAATTTPAAQAAAVSRVSFRDGTAPHAVVARDDDFADALAGSSLAYGVGPVLFAPRRGPLPRSTADELVRTLRSGATVYLLGGSEALDPGLETEIRRLGFVPRRLFGAAREGTAVQVARELRAMLRRSHQRVEPEVIVATRGNWPDAVAAGSLGATFGLPILLTGRDELHPTTRAYLAELGALGEARTVYVVGGTGVVGAGTAQAAGAAARTTAGTSAAVRRLAGPTRDATAVAVADELRRQLRRELGEGTVPAYAIAVDLDRRDSYAHALSASVLAATTRSVFVPVRGPSAPQRLTTATLQRFCGTRFDGLLAGGPDLLPDGLGAELVAVLDGSSPRC